MSRYIVRPSGLAFLYVLWDRKQCKAISTHKDAAELSKIAAKLNAESGAIHPLDIDGTRHESWCKEWQYWDGITDPLKCSCGAS